MKIHLGSDHAGFELKEALKAHLAGAGHEVIDHGASTYDGEDDYPDFIYPTARAVAAEPGGRGIILGGSGQGEAMTANRVPGVRAALYYGGSERIITLSREHNNANILSLGARFVSTEEALRVIDLWLATPFEGGCHQRRIEKIDGFH